MTPVFKKFFAPVLFFLATFAAGAFFPAFAQETDALDEIRRIMVKQIHNDAVVVFGDRENAKDHFLNRFLSTLPQMEDERSGETFYFVEGDIRLSKEGVRRYLEDMANKEKKGSSVAELLVNVKNGDLDYWKDPASRRLTYAVMERSFRTPEEARQAASDFEQAAANWENACPECGIKFIRVPESEAGEFYEKVTFVIRFQYGTDVVAYSFFPGDSYRELVIFPDYFWEGLGFSPVGILRHEIGHILGYRHEHIRDGIPGCSFEDHRWVPLSSYDPRSVMHYFCGGGGTRNMKLTETDKRAHRCLYLYGGDCP